MKKESKEQKTENKKKRNEKREIKTDKQVAEKVNPTIVRAIEQIY